MLRLMVSFLAFLRLVGSLYYTKHTSAFTDKSPANFLKTFSGNDVLNTHVQWLASIRETVWGSVMRMKRIIFPHLKL